jgi:RNA recognition motif-containing protein
MTTVYVSNFPFTTLPRELALVFQDFGAITMVRIQSKHGFSLGCGWVEFTTEDGYAACLAHQEPIVIEGRPLKIEPAKPKSEPALDSVFVHTIDQTVTVDDLKNHFAHYNVVDAKIVAHYENEKRKGFAFVKLNSQNDRDRAIAALNLSSLGGRTIFCCAASSPFEKASSRKFTNNRVKLQ